VGIRDAAGSTARVMAIGMRLPGIQRTADDRLTKWDKAGERLRARRHAGGLVAVDGGLVWELQPGAQSDRIRGLSGSI